MAYKWKPSSSQRKEFAQKMQNPEENAAYYANKEAKAVKRRSKSIFDYQSAGGNYTPTQEQFRFCLDNIDKFTSSQEITALNMVIAAYTCNEKTNHDYIHIVNEKRRANNGE